MTQQEHKEKRERKRERIREQIHSLGIEMKSPVVKLTCKKCNRNYEIKSKNKELYTEELKNNYICLLCRERR